MFHVSKDNICFLFVFDLKKAKKRIFIRVNQINVIRL